MKRVGTSLLKRSGASADSSNPPQQDELSAADLAQIASAMAASAGGLPIKDRKYRLKTYRQCFEVDEFIAWLEEHGQSALGRKVSREEAVRVGQQLHRENIIVHVVDKKKPFMEGLYFWRFTPEFLKSSGSQPREESTVNLFMPAMPPSSNALSGSQASGWTAVEKWNEEEARVFALNRPNLMLSQRRVEEKPTASATTTANQGVSDLNDDQEPLYLYVDPSLVTESSSSREADPEAEPQEANDERPVPKNNYADAYHQFEQSYVGTQEQEECVSIYTQVDGAHTSDTRKSKPKTHDTDVSAYTNTGNPQETKSYARESSIYSAMDSESEGSELEYASDSDSDENDTDAKGSSNSKLLEKSKGAGIQWNNLFQDLFTRFGVDDDMPNELYCLQNDFICAATTYARIIISEINLPNHQKTIQPVGIGGLAGGVKFIKNGILFKFALDSQLKVPDGRGGWSYKWMYGWDSPSHKNAGKAAGRELNGIQCMFVTFTPKLHYPLMCVVDHCGYRLVAVALLPISSDTIKYGSGDGGKTVHTDIPELNQAMAEACKHLGLCEHKVKNKYMYGPGDIEAHLGSDGRYYVLDFARLMPPESPPEDPEERREDARSVFYKLLRPEFVFSYKQKFGKYLCSDAFTAWGVFDPRAVELCRDVTEATRYLHTTVIPECADKLQAHKLVAEYCAFIQSTKSGMDQGYQEALELVDNFVMNITPLVHASGVNIRHLGRVRLLTRNEELRRLILSICVARVVKNNIREQMRALTSVQEGGSPTEEPFKKIICNNLNLLLGAKGSEVGASTYWREDIKKELRTHFRMVLTDEEKSSQTDLRQSMEMKFFFLYLSRIIGAQISAKAIKGLWKCYSSPRPSSFTMLQTDIVALSPRVKKAFFANLAAGIQAIKEATQITATDESAQQTVMRQLSHAKQILREAHIMVPTCPMVNLQYGISIAEIALRKGAARCDALFDSAYERFQASLAIKPLDATYATYTQTLRSHAAIKRANAQVDRAEELEKRAAELAHQASST